MKTKRKIEAIFFNVFWKEWGWFLSPPYIEVGPFMWAVVYKDA